MAFDYEKLHVYADALDFAVLAEKTIREFPKGRSGLADQLSRASISIVLNIAEGTGKFAPLDKRRYYLSALGSAAECSAVFDILRHFDLVSGDACDRAKSSLLKIGNSLGSLAKRYDVRE